MKMKTTLVAMFALLCSTVGACSSPQDTSMPQAGPATEAIGQVSQAVTYPWINPTLSGNHPGGSQSQNIASPDPANQVCGFQWIRGPLQNGMYVQAGQDYPSSYFNRIATFSTNPWGGPSVGAICAQSTSFTFFGSVPPISLSTTDVSTTQSSYDGSGNFTAYDFPGNGFSYTAAPMPVLHHVEGFVGASYTSPWLWWEQIAYSQEYADVHVDKAQFNCLGQPQTCGQKAFGVNYRFVDSNGSNQRIHLPVNDYLLLATSSGAQVLHSTTLPATDGMCYITSIANNFADVTAQAFAYVNGSGNWAFSVQGVNTAAAFSCVQFAN